MTEEVKRMTFKQFLRWCDERAHDGCWGMLEALICLDILDEMRKLPFWKRKKKWREYERDVVTQIVEPTNTKIRELMEARV